MSDTTTLPHAPSQVRFDTIALLLGCLAFAGVMAVPLVLNDSDTFWQIRTGDWILAHHAVPWTDPFSFTAGDRRWFPHEWLAEVILSLAFRAGGLPGVIVLTAAACGVTVAILARHLRRFLPGFQAFEGLIVGAGLATPSMLARPHLLAWPCLAIWCAGLAMARTRRQAPSWWLLPAMLLWVNLHGSFMFGLLLPFPLLLEAMLDRDADRRRVAIQWGRFIVAAWAVALINPAFAAGLLFPFRLLGMHSLAWVGEWAPTDFARPQPLEVAIAAGLLLGFSSGIRIPPLRLLMIVGLLHMALTHGRNQQLLGIVGICLLAEPVGVSLGRGPAGPGDRPMAWFGITVATVAMIVRLAVPVGPQRSGASFADLLASIPSDLRARPVLNDYGYGGWLIFDGVKPFIDSRADLYGDRFLTRYRRALAGGAPLRKLLDDYRIAWTIFPAKSLTAEIMDDTPGWHRLTENNGIVVHIRTDEAR